MTSEQALLISPSASPTGYNAAANGTSSPFQQDEDPSSPKHHVSSSKHELLFILKSSSPLVVSFFLQYFLSTICIFASGRLGARELAASSLAICTFNITAMAVYQGMATSLDSLCSQAYGSGQLHNVGVYFQRGSLIMMTVTVFPLSFIWWYSGTILSWVVPHDRELVQMCQVYLRILTAAAPAVLLFESGKRFLQAQHLFNVSTYVLLIACPLNLILNWLLVWHPTLGLGFVGAPWAMVIIYWFICFLLLGYVVFIDGKQCWGGLQWHKATTNWANMLKLAIPGVVMVEAEYLAFEVLTILAASFGTDVLAAQSIASNVGSLSFQLPFAVAVALSTRIGHFVGMHNITGARKVVKISVFVAGGISLFNCGAIALGRHFWSSIFTSSPSVMLISDKVLVLVGINQLADGVNVLAAGILRGQGRQQLGSVLNLAAYYAIALPVGYVLAFVLDLGIYGLWMGLIVGVLSLAVGEAICIYRSDWDHILLDSDGRHDH